MCELFGMSSDVPTGVNFSLHAFADHGGGSGPHADGWGVGWYEDGDARLVTAPEAAATSPWVRLLEDHELPTRLLLSHIRKATQGARAPRNTQPFVRELHGRLHLFAHNGDLKGIDAAPHLALGRARPVGETDSEHAFCALLARLETLWAPGRPPPPFEARLEAVVRFAAELDPLGPANFLYTDGEVLFAHGNRRTQAATGRVEAPGLWMQCAGCGDPAADLGGVTLRRLDGPPTVLLFASVPLSPQGWAPLSEGEVVAVRDGVVVARAG